MTSSAWMLRTAAAAALIAAMTAAPAAAGTPSHSPSVDAVRAYLPATGTHRGRLVIDVRVAHRGAVAPARLTARLGVVVKSPRGATLGRGQDARSLAGTRGRAIVHRIVLPAGAANAARRLRSLRLQLEARTEVDTNRSTPGPETIRRTAVTQTVTPQTAAPPSQPTIPFEVGTYVSSTAPTLRLTVTGSTNPRVTNLSVTAANCAVNYTNLSAAVAADGTFTLGRDPSGQPLVRGTFAGETVRVSWVDLPGTNCEVTAFSNVANWISMPRTGFYKYGGSPNGPWSLMDVENPDAPTLAYLAITTGLCPSGAVWDNLNIPVPPSGSFGIGTQPSGRPLITATIVDQQTIGLQWSTQLTGRGCTIPPGQVNVPWNAPDTAPRPALPGPGS
jgi:hypothetical protein